MASLRLIQGFLQQATENGSRSTVLKPLAWLMSMLIAATLSAFYFSAPPWVGILFAIFCSLTMLLYLITYIYCIATDKDALRSETYSIQKLAIEKGFVGDSIQGVIQVEPASEASSFPELPDTTSTSEDK